MPYNHVGGAAGYAETCLRRFVTSFFFFFFTFGYTYNDFLLTISGAIYNRLERR